MDRAMDVLKGILLFTDRRPAGQSNDADGRMAALGAPAAVGAEN
jgi:hypothetical protein